MTKFNHNLIGIGPLCDHDCRVIFDKMAVKAFSKKNTLLLRGHRKTTGAKLWRLSLRPHDQTAAPTQWKFSPVAFNDNNILSVGSLVFYLLGTAGFLFKSTWLEAIKIGNYAS